MEPVRANPKYDLILVCGGDQGGDCFEVAGETNRGATQKILYQHSQNHTQCDLICLWIVYPQRFTHFFAVKLYCFRQNVSTVVLGMDLSSMFEGDLKCFGQAGSIYR